MLSPERICVEMVLDGEATNTDAHAINYVEIENASGKKVQLRDQLTGQHFWVKPKKVFQPVTNSYFTLNWNLSCPPKSSEELAVIPK